MSSSTVKYKLPGFLERATKDLVKDTAAVADRPYPVFHGPRIAGFTPDQTAAFRMTRTAGQSYLPELEKASGAFQQFAQDTWPTHAAEYENPYNQQVVQRQVAEARRQADINHNQIGRTALASNAYGDDRYAILEAEDYRNTGRLLDDIALTGLERGYQSGMGQFNADRNARMGAASALAGVAQQRQNQALTNAGARWGIGQAQQDQGQKNLDLMYEDFQNQFDYPIQGLNLRTSIYSGVPYSHQEKTSGGGSTAGGILGGIGALAGGLLGTGGLKGLWPSALK